MLELKNVCSGYGKHKVLHGVSAEFERGRITAVIGPNGCGKSTLLKTAIGIVPADSGEITIDGQSLTGLSAMEVAQRVAYLAQGKGVADMTVYRAVLHGRFPHLGYPRRYGENDKKLAAMAMECMNIAHLADIPLAQLSGGMRQNAYIAMALCQGTDYILMDEPTTYLDISHQLGLVQTLKSLAKDGKGIGVVLHDLPLAMSFADRIILMESGKPKISGTPEEIYSSKAIDGVFGVCLKRCETETGFAYYYE